MCDHVFESRFDDSECSEAVVGPEDRGGGLGKSESG
jgi:hypothetical protein